MAGQGLTGYHVLDLQWDTVEGIVGITEQV